MSTSRLPSVFRGEVMPIGAIRITLVVALIATAACQSGTGPDLRSAMAQARWARHGPSSYRITVSRSCECLPEMTGPVIVTVGGGAIESRHYVSTGAVVPSTYAALFPSVNGLFEIIEAARREDPARLDVAYDPTYGYPTRISIDYDVVMADDEIVYRAQDFVPR